MKFEKIKFGFFGIGALLVFPATVYGQPSEGCVGGDPENVTWNEETGQILYEDTALGLKDEMPSKKEHEQQFSKDYVYESVEQMPHFPGGDAALQEYIASHIKYPEEAAKNGIQGRVTVRFLIRPDGSVSDVKVIRGKDPDLDKEAIRVCSTLPKFIPGKLNGQPVSTPFTLPINFKLPDPE